MDFERVRIVYGDFSELNSAPKWDYFPSNDFPTIITNWVLSGKSIKKLPFFASLRPRSYPMNGNVISNEFAIVLRTYLHYQLQPVHLQPSSCELSFGYREAETLWIISLSRTINLLNGTSISSLILSASSESFNPCLSRSWS